MGRADERMAHSSVRSIQVQFAALLWVQVCATGESWQVRRRFESGCVIWRGSSYRGLVGGCIRFGRGFGYSTMTQLNATHIAIAWEAHWQKNLYDALKADQIVVEVIRILPDEKLRLKQEL